jgi:hypothetical protein
MGDALVLLVFFLIFVLGLLILKNEKFQNFIIDLYKNNMPVLNTIPLLTYFNFVFNNIFSFFNTSIKNIFNYFKNK